MADIGRAALIQDMDIEAKKVTSWLFPDPSLDLVEMDPACVSRLRPDVMLVEF